MICPICKKEMVLDDTDYNFKGYFDRYYVCENGCCSCVDEFRFGKSVNIEWCFERD